MPCNNVRRLIYSILVSNCISLCVINKMVIPSAGFGTRFLPWTKTLPKEMLPLMNVPAIKNVVDAGINGGFSQFLIITRRQKESITDYFDLHPELSTFLNSNNKSKLNEHLNEFLDDNQFFFIRQYEQLGTGHAVMLAKNWVADDYFCVAWPDIVILEEDDLLYKMACIAEQEKATVIAVEHVPLEEVSNYGVVVLGKQCSSDVYEIERLVEKPRPEVSPSNVVNAGRFILTPHIFNAIQAIIPQSKNEIQLPDAINYLIQKGEKVLAYIMKGKAYDIGRPLPWLETNIRYALHHPEYATAVKKMLKSVVHSFD